MVSKNLLKFIKSLKIKKFRDQERLFLVEGRKNILELLRSDFEVVHILATSEFRHNLPMGDKNLQIHDATPKILADAGSFSTNDSGLAVVKMRETNLNELSFDDHIIVLDGASDPGNLGTIIRTLDWFGFDQLVCSVGSANMYNPKVISSSMGSFTRVKVFYTDVVKLLESTECISFGADLDGADPRETDFPSPSVIVFGSESHGISPEVSSLIKQKISIKKYGDAESLNLSIAAGIIISQLRA